MYARTFFLYTVPEGILLPFKVSWVADMLAEDEHISTIEAIRRVYSSAMYKQLEHL